MADRELVLDLETTGLDAFEHKIIEIGIVEIVGRSRTGNQFHHRLNPEREVDEGAARVHGFTLDDLKNEAKFAEVADDMWAFIDDCPLVIHNASFDVSFLDAEMTRLCTQRGQNFVATAKRCKIVDTLQMARSKHPSQRNSLDALIERYRIVGEERSLHGALKDAELLADVYLAMTGGQAKIFQDANQAERGQAESSEQEKRLPEGRPQTSRMQISDEEIAAHQTIVQQIAPDDTP